MILSKKYTPRWIVFAIDIFISLASIIIAYLLRFNFDIDEILSTNVATLEKIIPLVVGVRMVTFIFARTYAGIVRYTGLKDAQRIVFTNFFGSLALFIISVSSYKLGLSKAHIIPTSIIIVDFMTTVFFMTSLRWLVKAVFYQYRTSSLQVKKAAIFGTGPSAIAAKQSLDQDIESKYKVHAFFDEVKSGMRQKVEGINIFPEKNLEHVLRSENIDFLILAKPFESVEKKRQIVDLCLNNNVQVLGVPSVDAWINGELSSKQIKKIKIEELLERNPIVLDKEKIGVHVKGKVVLVTGAAGSIGSEMVRQIIKFEPKQLVLFDQAESPLYDIEMEIKESGDCQNFQIVIGDVGDAVRVDDTFKKYQPSIIYHAAAYKHVPMMENNPAEAIKTNIHGTKTIADHAVKYNADRFVMVSTDKAVNPTNVMGASKRIAEIYIQSLNATSSTSFITTRFGNVLGSNGSVIPRFRKQIEEGGPITVTHPQITRFFMTIPEACQLVLEAAAIGTGGEIFIFDMGSSVKIVDLAKKMIKLSGLNLGKDIEIKYTGLRPGEKLYEELLADKENTIPTHHSQIMIAKVRSYAFEEVSSKIDTLVSYGIEQDSYKMVGKMKEIVPEFVSQNSIFESLDKPVPSSN